MGKFKAALDTNKYEAYVTADSNEGMRVGANGTPTFFINGRQVVGAQPFEAFKTIIDQELAKAKK
jgi:protein-disulfide isomerase